MAERLVMIGGDGVGMAELLVIIGGDGLGMAATQATALWSSACSNRSPIR